MYDDHTNHFLVASQSRLQNTQQAVLCTYCTIIRKKKKKRVWKQIYSVGGELVRVLLPYE